MNAKKQIRKLKALDNMIGLNKFYSIAFTSGEIELQGEYSSAIAAKIIKTKFNHIKVDTQGYLNFTRNNINIVLT